jgi:hypothetical protein
MDRNKLVYQYKIVLNEIKPITWRRIVVPASYSFWDLHVAIQDAMGWSDSHLHLFRITNPRTGQIDAFGIPDDDPIDEEMDCLPGWEMPIAEYFTKPGDKAEYEYDFGDSWEHGLVLEGILLKQSKIKYPICLAGARACPPEDCGGVYGYRDMLKIIQNPSHGEHESMLEWLGGKYDPDVFDPNKVKFDNPLKRWRIAFTEQGE